MEFFTKENNKSKCTLLLLDSNSNKSKLIDEVNACGKRISTKSLDNSRNKEVSNDLSNVSNCMKTYC